MRSRCGFAASWVTGQGDNTCHLRREGGRNCSIEIAAAFDDVESGGLKDFNKVVWQPASLPTCGFDLPNQVAGRIQESIDAIYAVDRGRLSGDGLDAF